MNGFTQNIAEFLKGLTLGQKGALAAVVIGAVALLSAVAYWANKPDYALLFGSLGPEDANRVVETLQSERVKYQIRDAGSSIYVPRQDVYELRLRFAGQGVVSDGPVGYELFDGGTVGMTDFMQKLNLKRALEGELARTISSVRQVDIARVHLVIPERSPFRETQAAPTASVVLQLSGSARLSGEQIEGITALVSGAVEGLDPAQVTVLDTRGNMLSNPARAEGDTAETSNQLKQQRAIEQHLTEKGQSMLDQILGPGNSLVRVAASLDFSREISERDLIDPESATVVSEERLDEEGGFDMGASASSSIRNYEISRTRERSEKSVGGVSYLTVSVILNYKKTEGDDGEVIFTPYSDTEISEIEALVRNAVGFNPTRGDQVTTHQTRFDTSVDQRIADDIREQRRREQLELYLRYGLMLLAIGVAVWLILSATRRVTKAVESGRPILLKDRMRPGELSGDGAPSQPSLVGADNDEEDDEYVLVDDVYTSKLSPEAKARLKAKHVMFEELKSQVLAHPEEAADIFRSWLVENNN